MTRTRSERTAGALGIASAPLLIAGTVLIGEPTPDDDAVAGEYVAYFTDNVGQLWAGGVAMWLGLAAFLAFIAGVRGRLRAHDPSGGALPGLALAAGAAVVLFTLVGVTMTVGTASSTDFFDTFALDADTAQLVLGLTWLPSIYAGIAAAVAIAATTLAARRTSALSTGLVRAGYVLAPLAVVGAFGGVGLLVAMIWTLAVGVALAARPRGDGRPAAAGSRRSAQALA